MHLDFNLNVKFFEVSAKDGTNISELFEDIAETVAMERELMEEHSADERYMQTMTSDIDQLNLAHS